MMKFFYSVLLSLLFAGILSSCSSDSDGSDDPVVLPLRFNMGTSLSPLGNLANAKEADFIEYYSNDAHGRLRAMHLGWRDSEAESGQIPHNAAVFMAQQARFGFTPVIGFGWADGSGNPIDNESGDLFLTSTSEPLNNTWSNMETRNKFKQMVTEFAEIYKPAYLFLGNETNSYFVREGVVNPAAAQQNWDNWISIFEQSYDEIKAVSPATVVYTSFQLDKLKNKSSKTGVMVTPQYQLIDDHIASGKIDAIAFTTYPYFEYDSPADMPDDYYSELIVRVAGKKIIYSEVGWLANDSIVPYKGSETLQANFVDRFFELNQSVDMEYAVWLFLYDFTDYTNIEAFTDIALRNNDGSIIRAADQKWQDFAQQTK